MTGSLRLGRQGRRLAGIACALISFAAFAVPDSRAADEFQLLRLDGLFVKWGDPALGTGATVSYAFVERDMQFRGARNCERMTPLASLLQRSAIKDAALRDEVAAAFAMWEQAADIRFVRSDDPDTADILIGAQALPVGWAFANVSYRASAENSPARKIDKSLICLNPARPWKVGFGGNASAYDLRYTVAHEIGHAIGLNHSGPSGQLMSFRYGEGFRSLQPGDLRGAVALYGLRDGPSTASVPTPTDAATPEMGLR